MILEISVNNYKVFSNEVSLSLLGDMRTRRLDENIYHGPDFDVLKSACIYGQNNVGKSCFIQAIDALKHALGGSQMRITSDLLNDHNICKMAMTFSYNDEVYDYAFKFDSRQKDGKPIGFIYESFSRCHYDKQKRKHSELIYELDVNEDYFKFPLDPEISKYINISHDVSILYSINPKTYPTIAHYQEVCKNFASSIMVIRGESQAVDVSKTLDILKDGSKEADLVIELIKAADIDIEDFGYDKNIIVTFTDSENKPVESENHSNDDIFKIYSTRKGDPLHRHVPSLVIDSLGTRKLVALAGYVVDALLNDKILIIDELGNSLHYRLSKAIVSMFNSEMNRAAQLIFTTQDTALLDGTTLFRKEQIWFMQKEDGKEYLYSLSDFTVEKDKVRNTSDFQYLYQNSYFGGVPHINVFDSLCSIEDERNARESLS